MAQFNDRDYVKVELDLYANGKLVQTTNKKKAEENKIEAKDSVFEPQTMVIGKGALLVALDEDMKKNANLNEKRTLELSVEDAFGKRKKELIKTFQKKVFTEQNLRVVPGVTYDFNGMFGTVKSVVGGRVMVDFNNPLSGKDIKVEYSIVEKVEDIKERITFIFKTILKMPESIYKLESKDKEVTLKIPKELFVMKDQLTKTFEEFLSDFKDLTFKFEELEKPKK